MCPTGREVIRNATDARQLIDEAEMVRKFDACKNLIRRKLVEMLSILQRGRRVCAFKFPARPNLVTIPWLKHTYSVLIAFASIYSRSIVCIRES